MSTQSQCSISSLLEEELYKRVAGLYRRTPSLTLLAKRYDIHFQFLLLPRTYRMMSNGKPTENSDSSYMSGIPTCCLLRAMQPTRSLLRWTDDLHMIFVEAVEYQGGPHEAKPTAVKQRMEAMGVAGLTIWNIKSHLQRYREKCGLGAEPPRDVLGTASPSKAVDNVTSEAETVVDSDAATNLTEMETVSYLLMDDTEVVDSAFSADELQMMEKELMNAIQA